MPLMPGMPPSGTYGAIRGCLVGGAATVLFLTVVVVVVVVVVVMMMVDMVVAAAVIVVVLPTMNSGPPPPHTQSTHTYTHLMVPVKKQGTLPAFDPPPSTYSHTHSCTPDSTRKKEQCTLAVFGPLQPVQCPVGGRDVLHVVVGLPGRHHDVAQRVEAAVHLRTARHT